MEPSGPFITSIMELKLDSATSFEWQKASQDVPDVPHYSKLLDFLNLRAQASEASANESKKSAPRLDDLSRKGGNKQISSFVTNATDQSNHCCLCKTEKHLIFACPQFKTLNHDRKMSTVKSNDLCINCLRPGHFVRQCRSTTRCRKCQKSHHTLLHVDLGAEPSASPTTPATNMSVNASTGTANSLLMTCCVLSQSSDGVSIDSRALLDSASSTSFVSERLAQALRLPRSHREAQIHGVAGLYHGLHTCNGRLPVLQYHRYVNPTRGSMSRQS